MVEITSLFGDLFDTFLYFGFSLVHFSIGATQQSHSSTFLWRARELSGEENDDFHNVIYWLTSLKFPTILFHPPNCYFDFGLSLVAGRARALTGYEHTVALLIHLQASLNKPLMIRGLAINS